MRLHVSFRGKMTRRNRRPPQKPKYTSNAASVQSATQVAPSVTPAGMAPLPNQTAGIAAQVSIWQGQFPPPEAVRVYDEVHPGAWHRIIAMAEKQQDAVIQASAQAMDYQQKDTRRGQVLGALVTLACIAGAVYCAIIGQPWVAGGLVAVPVMAVPIALINGRRQEPAKPDRTQATDK